MLRISEVAKEFMRISGLDEESTLELDHLLAKSAGDIEGLVDKSIDVSKYAARLYYAAAALAYYRYIVTKLTSADNVEYVSAGDIKISHDNSRILEIAREIKEDALNSLNDLKKGCDAFIFKRM